MNALELELPAALEKLTALRGTNEKINFMAEQFALGEELYAFLHMTYNPFQTYGIDDTSFLDHIDQDNYINYYSAYDRATKTCGLMSLRFLTGQAAKTELQTILAPSKSAAELIKKILKKDARAGVNISSVNKAAKLAKKRPIPVFEVMLAHKYEPKRLTDTVGYIVEPKLDGVRAIVECFRPQPAESAIISFSNIRTRNGKELPAVDWLAKELEKHMGHLMPDDWKDTRYFVDCEVISGTFNETVSGVRKGSVEDRNARLHIFDIVTPSEFEGEKKTKLYQRLNRLQKLRDVLPEGSPFEVVEQTPVPVGTNEEIHDYLLARYEEYRDKGLEGAIVKPLSAVYEPKRSYGWLKIKAQETEDLEIIDVVEGTGKYVGMLGAVVVNRDGVEVKVGSGFSDDQRGAFWLDKDWLIGKVIEVEYHEVTPDGSLRHPRFKRMRLDK